MTNICPKKSLKISKG